MIELYIVDLNQISIVQDGDKTRKLVDRKQAQDIEARKEEGIEELSSDLEEEQDWPQQGDGQRLCGKDGGGKVAEKMNKVGVM